MKRLFLRSIREHGTKRIPINSQPRGKVVLGMRSLGHSSVAFEFFTLNILFLHSFVLELIGSRAGKEAFHAGRLSEAISHFEEAARDDPSFVYAWVQLGIAQAENDHDDLAIQAFQEALKIEPNNLQVPITSILFRRRFALLLSPFMCRLSILSLSRRQTSTMSPCLLTPSNVGFSRILTTIHSLHCLRLPFQILARLKNYSLQLQG